MSTQEVKGTTLETLVGPLAEIFPKFYRSTILHADQLTNKRRTEEDEEKRLELRNIYFHTADSSMYTVEKVSRRNEAFLYLGREPTNPIFNNIEEATQQLIRTGNYILTTEKRGEIDAVITAEDTLKVKLSDLELQKPKDRISFFDIHTNNHYFYKLNPEQQSVAERIYGQGDDFKENMEMFYEGGITRTRVYVLNPDYVKKNVPRDGALVRASGLSEHVMDNDFINDIWIVGNRAGLHGVRNRGAGNVMQGIDPAYVKPLEAMMRGDDVLNTPKGDYVRANSRPSI